jgi:thioredoxin-like negative regulator of GroEL
MKKIVKFWGTGCMPCTQYAPIFEKVSKDLSDLDEFEFVNIDARSDNTGLVQKLGIRSIPQTYVLDENNNVLKQKTGFINELDLRQFILEN